MNTHQVKIDQQQYITKLREVGSRTYDGKLQFFHRRNLDFSRKVWKNLKEQHLIYIFLHFGELPLFVTNKQANDS